MGRPRRAARTGILNRLHGANTLLMHIPRVLWLGRNHGRNSSRQVTCQYCKNATTGGGPFRERCSDRSQWTRSWRLGRALSTELRVYALSFGGSSVGLCQTERNGEPVYTCRFFRDAFAWTDQGRANAT